MIERKVTATLVKEKERADIRNYKKELIKGSTVLIIFTMLIVLTWKMYSLGIENCQDLHSFQLIIPILSASLGYFVGNTASN